MSRITDQINSVTPAEATRIAFQIIDGLQHQKEGHFVAASVLLFLMLCHRYGESPREVLNKAACVLADAYRTSEKREHIYALQEYLAKELS